MSASTPGADPGGLPGGAALAPGEQIVLRRQFMLSTLAFYLHTDWVLTNRRLFVIRPNTAFGLIPVGTGRSSYPIEAIAGVDASSRFDILGVIIGLIGLLFGLAALAVPSAGALGVIVIVLSLGAIIGAPKASIFVTNSGGGRVGFPASVLERAQINDFANRVSEAVVRTTHQARSTPTEPSPAASTPADPTAALQQLAMLRDQGLITPEEYAAKRSGILDRL
jgi:Short C-terminal domain